MGCWTLGVTFDSAAEEGNGSLEYHGGRLDLAGTDEDTDMLRIPRPDH